MKIGIIGFGKMGRLIAEVSAERGHIPYSIDPTAPDADAKALDRENARGLDVCIEFTVPGAALGNIRNALDLRVPLVVGTTGWYDSLETVKSLVEQSGTGFVYASNFSLGVNLFKRMVEQAAAMMNQFDEYDAAGVEYHHNQKQDSPSGTALTLAEAVLAGLSRKTDLVTETLADRRPEPHEFQFASVRCGSFPGTHEILFDSPFDTITLRHTARTRRGFALGAVLAAEWVSKRVGFFTIDDVLSDLLANNFHCLPKKDHR